MPAKEFLDYALSVSLAMDDIHNKGHIHGDIRPDNITWEPNNQIATILGSSRIGEEYYILHAERLLFISPEQTGRMNRRVDYRTDFYSVGTISCKQDTFPLNFLTRRGVVYFPR